jgi:hypothetical protein
MGGYQKLAEREVSAAVQGRKSRGPQDEMLRIEALAPGFAGFYKDSTGALVLLITKPANQLAAETAIKQTIGRRVHHEFNALGTVTKIRFLPATYSISQLIAWQTDLRAFVFPVSGFSSLSVREKENKVVIEVMTEAAREQVLTILNARGVPADAVSVRIEAPIAPASGLRGTRRPTFGGVRIKPDYETNERIFAVSAST